MISDPQLPQAVLFDMDGTLVDTEPMWVATEAEVAASFGHTWTAEDQRYCLGASATTVAAYIAERTGTRTPQGEIIDMMYAAVARRMAEGPALRPGAKELLAELDALGVPMALVTSTYRSLLGAALGGIGDHYFTVTVAGDEVAHTKPHPEPYLKAARLLGADPRRCVAVEDSPTGAASAQAAGCTVVAVPHAAPVPEAERRYVISSLEEIDAAWLGRVARS